MAFQAIAYAPDERCIVTLDGAELLAHDAESEAPKWRLTLDRPGLDVRFVDAGALPGDYGGNPWRTAPLGRVAVVVDHAGQVSLVDTTSGQIVGRLGPFGAPLAMASSPDHGLLAVATDDAIFVWRSGRQLEVPVRLRASALAFSSDGAVLAIGTAKGEVRMFAVAALGSEDPLEETARVDLGGAVADIAQHPGGPWVVAGTDGVHLLTKFAGAERLEKISPGIKRVRFDAVGERLAVQRTDRALVVYDWPSLSVAMRIEYMERPVRGLAFGPQDWLGVALDHGDANKIDLATSDVHRTDTHPGRKHRSWTLLVEGARRAPADGSSERSDPFDVPRQRTSRPAMGGRIGIGAMLTLALLGLRVCVRASAPSPSFRYDQNLPSVVTRCDKACASLRLQRLHASCALVGSDACANVTAAETALAVGNCAAAKAALTRIPKPQRGAGGPNDGRATLFDTQQTLALLGVTEACSSGAIRPIPPPRHAQLVRLDAKSLTPHVEYIPEVHGLRGESPQAVLALPDGTVFVATTTSDSDETRSVLYRRNKVRSWDVVYQAPTVRSMDSAHFSLTGRSASDVWMSDGTNLAHFDGTKAIDVGAPTVSSIVALGSVGPEVFLIGRDVVDDSMDGLIFRRRGASWVSERGPESHSFSQLALTAGSSSWAVAYDPVGRRVLLQRTTSGAWVSKQQTGQTGLSGVRSAWVSPTGDVFAAMDTGGVARSVNSGGAWSTQETPETVDTLWGRSSDDVYGGTGEGLVHFDGKRWTETPYTPAVRAISGTATEVFVIREAE